MALDVYHGRKTTTQQQIFRSSINKTECIGVRIDYGQQLVRHNTRHDWSHEQLGMRLFLFVSTVGQGPTALAVGAGGGYLDIFTLIYPFSPLSPSLWDTA